ncbi:MAG: PDZ domain-containing protein [Bacteroidia bacterium]|nr:PDZ domain-containing protein [Bacteroidia bacterium]NNC86771.1 M61 family metallopeptidase [Bacteroidia bacterium]
MQKLKILASFVIIYIGLIGHCFAQNGSIHYTLEFPEPHTHYVDVEMVIDNLSSNDLEIVMPVWAPGSYKVRDFSKHTEAIVAKDEQGSELDVEVTSKNTWLVNTKGKSKIEFSYRVYAYELSVRTSFINADHAYLNGTSIFMYAEGMQDREHTLTVVPNSNWKEINTGLKIDKKNKWAFSAENYDELADCPIEIGNQNIFSFKAEGVNHIIAMVGEANYDIEKIKTDFATVAKVCKDVFGDIPVKEYTYIIQNTNNRGGGLEHSNSTSLQVDRWSYEPRSAYLRIINLAIHEYFHLWNVKRLRPEALGPFDYTKENYTTQLWVMEGITSYYDELLMLRGDFISKQEYLSKLTSSINRVENSPATDVQSLSESSMHSWIKFYHPHENSGNTNISYYTKGQVVAAMLDLLIIKETNGEKSLDDLMSNMYQKYYVKENRGYKDEEFEAEVASICGSEQSAFFRDYVYGTKRIDFDSFLNPFGLHITNLRSNSKKTKLGIRTKVEDGKLILTRTDRHSSAYESGLNVNDEIMSIDNYRINSMNELNDLISRKNAGDVIQVLISRDAKTFTIPVKLKIDNSVNYVIEKLKNRTEKQESLYDAWLNN